MTLSYEYSTKVAFAPSVGQHNILLRCLPSRAAFQHVCRESFRLSDAFWHKEGVDGMGNRVVSGGTSERHHALEYCSQGVVETSTYCIPDSEPHHMFLLPSRLTTVGEDAKTLMPELTGDTLADCISIAHAVHRHIDYTPGATTVLTTAEEAFRLRKGVCQDYAHLMTALCRVAGIPSRYVCGLMLGEGSTHAWVEAHDGTCWYAFDPTNDTAIATGYIKLAHGRDALDCPVSRGSFIGNTIQQTEIRVTVTEL